MHAYMYINMYIYIYMCVCGSCCGFVYMCCHTKNIENLELQCSWDAASSICSPSPICPGNTGTRGHPLNRLEHKLQKIANQQSPPFAIKATTRLWLIISCRYITQTHIHMPTYMYACMYVHVPWMYICVYIYITLWHMKPIQTPLHRFSHPDTHGAAPATWQRPHIPGDGRSGLPDVEMWWVRCGRCGISPWGKTWNLLWSKLVNTFRSYIIKQLIQFSVCWACSKAKIYGSRDSTGGN